MAETELPTYQEATRCPKCDKPGNVRIRVPAPRAAKLPPGTQIHTAYCENPLCKWYDQVCRLVQVNPDGSVPAPRDHRHEPKLYTGLPDDEALSNQILAGLARQAEAEITPGAEVRNRGIR
jgi:hypothetical protein